MTTTAVVCLHGVVLRGYWLLGDAASSAAKGLGVPVLGFLYYADSCAWC